MADFYPYLNRGAYKWIPDDYAATSGANFGVFDAYNFAVCNHGRHINVLAGKEARMAFGTTIVCKGLRDQNGSKLFNDENVHIYRPGDVDTPPPIMDVFRSTIRRSTSIDLLTNIPIPNKGSGIGFSYEDIAIDPFFFFSTMSLTGDNNPKLALVSGMGKIASLDVNYMLATSKLWQDANVGGNLIHSSTNPPLAIMAVLDKSLIDASSTWWETTRGISTDTKWGPPKDQAAVDSHTKSACASIQSMIGSSELTAVFLPMYIYSNDKVDTYAELEITNPGVYPGPNPDWSILSRNEDKNIKLSGKYWTSLEYFPEIVGFLIMPNWRVFEGNNPQNPQSTSSPSAKDNSWNAVVSGLRVYDALQANTTPEHLETTTQIINGKEQQTIKEIESQLPCEIFGYAWRISHPVIMTKYALPIQPSRGTLASDNPQTGLGNRISSFYFKIYHPKIQGLGIAHGVRFYYGVAIAAMPGTSIYSMGAYSLAGVLTGLAADADFLLVSYIAPVPGVQSLTFQFGYNQYGDVGKVAYSGDFAYSKETVAVRCGYIKRNSESQPSQISAGSMAWLQNNSAVPSSDINGTRVLYYDNDPTDADIKWYGFASINAFGVSGFDPETFGATYFGGVTPLIKGAPQTNLSGPGAFNMNVSSFSSFIGEEKLTVYNKPEQYGFSAPDIDSICSDDNNHLATFVSEVRNIGPDVQLYGGTWRLRLAASTDSTVNLNSHIFFRFAFIPEKYNGEDIDLSTVNASALWNIPHYEFHFRRVGGNYHIYNGKPSFNDVIITPVLTENEEIYNLGWDVYFGSGDNVVDLVPDGSEGSTDKETMLNKRITLLLSSVMPGMEGTRLVVQAWSASFSFDSRYANSNKVFDPLKHPTVKLSWSGETESYFQTMILETRSNEILAQQDPFVFGNNVESYDFITFSPCDQSEESKTAQEENEKKQQRAEDTGELYIPPLYRSYKLWENSLSFDDGQIKPSEGGAGGYSTILGKAGFGRLTNSESYIANSGRVSFVNFAIPEILDLIEEKAQIADVAILADIGGSVVGGTTIGPLKLDVSFDYLLNASNFSLKYTVELLAAPSSGITTYLIGRSGLQTIDSSINPNVTDEFSGRASFTIFVNSQILIPDPDSMLLLRFKIWPKSNGTNPTSIQDSLTTVFASIDIDNFRMQINSIDETERKTIDVITNYQFIRGSSEWYEDLNITTSRTFGSQCYYFVPDETSRNTSIMPPLTMSQYGYWNLDGWIFSPFWFLQMPEGACIEIKDDAGLTAGNAVTGSGFGARERAQRVLMFRTAIGTLPSASVSSDLRSYENAGGKGVVAKQRIEVSGATTATNFISIAHNVQNSDGLNRSIGESFVQSGENIISGKNPLIITGSPGNNITSKLYSGNPSTAYLFYEEDNFDIDTHSSIAMLANYDGTFMNWNNPYGKRSSGQTSKVIINTDMRLIGAGVDLFGYGIYIAGYRANNLTNPAAGGTIVVKKINPGLVFGTESAHVGPLHIVDGLVTAETYNVSSFKDVQPVLPLGLNGETQNSTLNNFSSSGTAVPAAESFPDVISDPRGYLYVFYSLLARDANEARNVLGKVFCRESHNAGYWFNQPYPIVDLGYKGFLQHFGASSNAGDTSFQAKHITCVYNSENSIYCIFFWANGKIFMRMTHHPGIDFENFKFTTPASAGVAEIKKYYESISSLYMIEGDTSFTDDVFTSNLDIWLNYQWQLGDAMSDTDIDPRWVGDYSSKTSNDVSDKNNNFKRKENSTIGPFIKILKYSNSLDVPPQRVGVVVNEKSEILVFYLNNIGSLVYKKIALFGNGPAITPAVTVSLSQI